MATVVATVVVLGAASMWDLTVSNVHDFAVGTGQFVAHNCTDPLEAADKRAHELQSALPEGSQGRVTMGVGLTDDGRVIVGTSEDGGYLRSGVRALIQDGDIVADGVGHAEVSVINKAKQLGLRVIAIGSGRPICGACETFIREELGEEVIGSVTKNGFIPPWMR